MLRRVDGADGARRDARRPRASPPSRSAPASAPAPRERALVAAALAAPAAAVLDADALTAFAAEPDALFAAIAAPRGAGRS